MAGNKVVIVGGGIAGIFCALLYSKKGWEVTLVEKEYELGGLLRSQELFSSGYCFDYGTHFLRETGVAEIDHILFSGLNAQKFDYLKVGSFYKNLYEKNGFLCDETLDQKDRSQYLEELIHSEKKDFYDNLQEQLIGNYGLGYAKNLVEPSVKKFFFTDPKDLVVDCHQLFGLGRIIAGTSEQTNNLKKDKNYDNVLAYHTYLEGGASLKSMYPSVGGAGEWIKSLTRNLEKNGVTIITGKSVDAVYNTGGRISSVKIENDELEIDELVWTIPLFFLLQKLNIRMDTKPPKRLTSCIFHFVIEENYLTDLYYFQCFDPMLKTFRVTLYDNYSSGLEGKRRITVEVLLEYPPDNVKNLEQEVFEELKLMKVIPTNCQPLHANDHIYPNGFPVVTNEFVEGSRMQYEMAIQAVSNLRVFGKSNGTTWLMNDIIHDIYNTIG